MSVSIAASIFRQAGTDSSLLNFLTANTAAFTTLTVTGSSGSVTSVTIGGVQVLGATVAYTTSTVETARLIAAQINAFSSTHKAFRSGDAGAVVTIQALTGGSGQNGQALAITSTLAITNGGSMAGGGATGATAAGAGTANAEGSYYTYLLGNNNVQVYGSLTINPTFENATFGTGASGSIPRFDVRSGGVLTLGGRVSFDGVFNYTEGLVIHDPLNSSAFNEPQAIIRVESGGTLDWFGGIVQGRACLGFMAGATAIRIYSKNAVIKALGLSTASNELLQIRQRAATTEIYGITLENCDLVFIAQPAITQGLQPSSAGKSVTFSTASPANVWFIITDYDPFGGATVDVAFHSSKWASIDDCATGTALDSVGHFGAGSTNNRGLHRYRQAVTFEVVDSASSGVNGRVFARDTNNGARIGANVFGTNPSFTADHTYESAIVAGAASFTGESRVVVAYRYQNTANVFTAPTASIATDFRGVDNSTSDRFRFALAAYGFEPATTIPVLKGIGGTTVRYTLLADLGVTAAKAVAATYTDRFTIASNGDITVTSDATLDQLYDYAAYWLEQSGANMEAAGLGNKLVSFDGQEVITGANFIVGAGATLSSGSKFSALTTTGTLTITGTLNIRSYTSPAGTFVQVSVAGIRNGTKVRIIRTDTGAELAIGNAGSSGFSAILPYSADLPIRANTVYVSGIDAEEEASALGTLTANGAALTIVQIPSTIYEENGIAGSSVTGLTLDSPNIEIDADEVDNAMTVQEIYAWVKNELMTDAGIRTLFGAITAENAHKYRINSAVVPLKIDQKDSVNSLVLSGGLLYRDDGASIRLAGSGVIEFVLNDVYESQAAESSLAAIKSKTDNLPIDPADQSTVSASISGVPSAVWGAISEAGQSYGKQFRDIRATLVGTTSGRGTPTEVFNDSSGDPRVVSNNDGTNRTSVVVSGS